MSQQSSPRAAKDLRPHPLADLFPLLTGPDLDALAKDIRVHGLRQPIVLYQGKVLDGRNRLAACKQAGVDPRFEKFEGSEDEALSLVLSLNLARRHLSTAQKAALAVKLLPLEQQLARVRMLAGKGNGEDPHQKSDEGPRNGQALDLAGQRTGVSRDSVWRAAKIQEAAPDVFQAIVDGVIRSLPEAQRVAEFQEPQRKKVLARIRKGFSLRQAVDAPAYWTRQGASSEWYTPPEVLEAARRAMGGPITLDPASSSEAQLTVQARRYYTAADDGLARPWRAARLLLNPPYGAEPDGTSRQATWVAKLIEEHDAGRTKQAIVVIRAATETAWFRSLWRFIICFVQGRIEFVPGPGSKSTNPTVSSAIVGVGVSVDAFAKEFQEWGQIVVPVAAGTSMALPPCQGQE